MLFEGWDASGKGGAIKRLVAPLDARHVRVASFAAPTPDEKRHHYLHRFVPALPGWGGMAVLDRTWYGRVLVERVEGFATEEQWRRAYDEIDDFERMLADEGMIIVKFWLHISDEEQLKRFERRRQDPLKTWKLTDEDWRNREKRPAYEAAVEEMFERTDTEHAPWRIVPGESKRYARVQVMQRGHRRDRGGLRAQRASRCPAPLEAVDRLGVRADERPAPAREAPAEGRQAHEHQHVERGPHAGDRVGASSTSGRKTTKRDDHRARPGSACRRRR